MPYTPPTGAGNVTTNGAISGTAVSTLKPANIADNDLICLVGYKQLGGATFSAPPAGFTSRYVAVAPSTRGLQVWTKKLSGAGSGAAELSGGSTYGLTASEGSSRWLAVAFRLPGMVGFDAAPASDAYGTNLGTVVLPSVTAVAASTLILAVNFANNSSAVYPAFTSPGFATLAHGEILSGASTSTLDVAYKEDTGAGETGDQTFSMVPDGASFGGFLLTLAITPSLVNPALTTIGDLEYGYLRNAAELPTPTKSLQDLRETIYGASEHAYFAGLSGLTPPQNFSLSDHKLAYYRGVAGLSTGTLADAMQEALN